MNIAARPALVGFTICAAITLLTYIAMFVVAPWAVEGHVRTLARQFVEPEFETRQILIDYSRGVASAYLKFMLLMSGAYWTAAALLCRGKAAILKWANIILALAYVLIFLVYLNTYAGWADTYCDQLPMPHKGFQLARIFECPSSDIFFSGLMALGLSLVVLSLLMRMNQTKSANPKL